jgi:hypothetical protein
MNPQLPDFPSNNIGIGPLEIGSLFLKERKMRGYLRPRLLVQPVKEFINGRIASLGCIQNKTVQIRLRDVLPLYIIFDVLSSSPFSLRHQEFFDIGSVRYEKLEKAGISKPQCLADAEKNEIFLHPFCC